jgi:hypothetical protein
MRPCFLSILLFPFHSLLPFLPSPSFLPSVLFACAEQSRLFFCFGLFAPASVCVCVCSPACVRWNVRIKAPSSSIRGACAILLAPSGLTVGAGGQRPLPHRLTSRAAAAGQMPNEVGRREEAGADDV